MLMPKKQGYQYIVAARDDLSRALEGRALKKSTAQNLAKFFWDQIFCRYGVVKVVTDNGPEVQVAFTELMDKYGIPQIQILAYNSKANGVVECGHFIICEAIVKTCAGNVSNWPDKVQIAFFADKVTIMRSTGFSPFYLLHGVDPVLPFDLLEATFLATGFAPEISTMELLVQHIRQLEKRDEDMADAADRLSKAHFKSKEQFEWKFARKLSRKIFEEGDLVLVRNTQVEKELNQKMKPKYLGPYWVICRTYGGSYIIQELDGAISRRGIAAFRLIPYIARNSQQLQSVMESQDSDEDIDESEDSDLEKSGDDSQSDS